MKIDDKTQRSAGEAQVRKQLRVVNRLNRFHTLNLDYHGIFYEQVNTVADIEL